MHGFSGDCPSRRTNSASRRPTQRALRATKNTIQHYPTHASSTPLRGTAAPPPPPGCLAPPPPGCLAGDRGRAVRDRVEDLRHDAGQARLPHPRVRRLLQRLPLCRPALVSARRAHRLRRVPRAPSRPAARTASSRKPLRLIVVADAASLSPFPPPVSSAGTRTARITAHRTTRIAMRATSEISSRTSRAAQRAQPRTCSCGSTENSP